MPVQSPSYDLELLRRQFEPPRRGIAYLNNAGMSPLPEPVKRAMIDSIDVMATTGSDSYTELLAPMVDRLRQRLAELVNCEPSEVAFVENTSMGLNLIAQSLPLAQGDNVLLCDLEFPSNVYCWQNLRHKGVETKLIPARRGGLLVESLDTARDLRSRAVAVSGIQFFSGRREDLFHLGEYCKAYDLWLIVDAMQMAGIAPLDMRAMNIAALASGGQKAMMGPPGQGFMAIQSALLDTMQPPLVGPLSVVDHEFWLSYDLTLKADARRFDLGTFNLAGLAGLLAAVELVQDLDVSSILEWVVHLSDVAIADLKARGLDVVTPEVPTEHANIVTFAVQNAVVAERRLRERGIILRSHQDRKRADYLRISSHGYNTEDDILRVGQALEELRHEQH